jgi:hypothetical protein
LPQDRVDIEWLAEVTSSLRFGGEADTQLYCWLAKEGVLAALLEVAEVLGSRPGQVRAWAWAWVRWLCPALRSLSCLFR